jgi:hypothetical protein
MAAVNIVKQQWSRTQQTRRALSDGALSLMQQSAAHCSACGAECMQQPGSAFEGMSIYLSIVFSDTNWTECAQLRPHGSRGCSRRGSCCRTIF